MCDQDIIDYFIDENRAAIISARINYNNLIKKPEYKEYLDSRYEDAEFDVEKGHLNYCSVVARIYWKIDIRPKCKNCGAPLNYRGFHKPYGTWCDSRCQLSDREFIETREKSRTEESRAIAKEKAKKTCLEKYGVENYHNIEKFKNTIQNRTEERNKEIQDKRIRTCLEKYGTEYAVLTDEAKALAHSEEANYKRKVSFENTMTERYGGKYTLQSPILVEKVKNTKLKLYGDAFWVDREKAKATLKEKTGYENPYQIPWVRERINYDDIIETKRRNGTLNSSSAEIKLGDILKGLYDSSDVFSHYKDERYKNPDSGRAFVCDFYIKSIDLFIEYQGSQFHHSHPFNPESEEDILELSKLILDSKRIHESKGISRCQADNIIYDWTIRDPMKRDVAKNNGLRYLEIWNPKEELVLTTIQDLISSIVND